MASPTADAVAADDRKGKRPMKLEEADEAAALPPAAAVQGEEEGKEKENEKGEAAEEGEKLVLVSDDGVEVLASVAAARVSKTLRGMIEDECATGRIPITGVHSDVLALLVEYCERHAPHYDPEASARDRYPFPPFPVELPPFSSSIKPVTFVDPDADPHGLKAFDKKFLDVDNHGLCCPQPILFCPNWIVLSLNFNTNCAIWDDVAAFALSAGCQLPEHRGAARRRVHHGGGQDEGEDAGGDTRHLRDRERLHTGAGGGGQEGERMGLRGLKGEEGLV